MEIDNTTDDWSAWRNHVLAELKRQNDNIEALREKIDACETSRLQADTNTQVNIKELQTKIWAMCAAISVAISVVIHYLP